MTPVSAKKILDLVPKVVKKSKGTTDPLDKFKNKVEKKFTKLTNDHKNLKEQFKSDSKNTIKELKTLRAEIELLKKDSAALLDKFSEFSETTHSEIRAELVNGIRSVGDRVTDAINELNERSDNFSKQVDEKIEEIVAAEKEKQKKENPFGSLKEGALLEMDAFEVVPKDAIETLTQLFKNQTGAVKNFINKQDEKMGELEQNQGISDEEYTQLFGLMNKRIERNFRYFLYAVGVIIVLLLLLFLV